MREVKQHSSLKRDAAMSVCTLGHTLLSCSTYRLTQHVEPVNFRTQKSSHRFSASPFSDRDKQRSWRRKELVLCRSALEYPPNGKRCEKNHALSPAQLEERRLKRNAREKELYHARKTRKMSSQTHSFVREVEPEDLYAEQKARLREVGEDTDRLMAKNSWLGDAEVGELLSSEGSRHVAAHILMNDQHKLAYLNIEKRDRDFAVNCSNDVKRLFLEDGTIGYFKSYEDQNSLDAATEYDHDLLETFNNEVVAYRLAQVLGEGFDNLVPPTVLREYEGQLGSFQLEAEGQVTHSPFERPNAFREFSPTHLRKAALFDYLAGSQDRHGDNYTVVTRPGWRDEIRLIDNGFSFPYADGTSLNSSVVLNAVIKLADQETFVLTEEEISAVNTAKQSLADGVMKELLSESQRKFMNTRIDLLLSSGELTIETAKSQLSGQLYGW